MNSLFNYELDERQIRLTLHDAELGYSEAAWMEFDAAYPGHANTGAKLSQFNLPKVNLNINRNVLVPLFFIIALGGVSAVMFRFIDFKTNKPVEVEKALLPDAANFRPAKKELPPSPEPKAQTAAVTPALKKDTAAAVINTPSPAVTVPAIQSAGINTLRNSANRPAYTPSLAAVQKVVTDSAVNAAPGTLAGDSSASVQAPANPQTAASGKDNPYYYKGSKKRRKKVTADQVESLKAPTLLSTQTAEAEPEPELRLK